MTFKRRPTLSIEKGDRREERMQKNQFMQAQTTRQAISSSSSSPSRIIDHHNSNNIDEERQTTDNRQRTSHSTTANNSNGTTATTTMTPTHYFSSSRLVFLGPVELPLSLSHQHRPPCYWSRTATQKTKHDGGHKGNLDTTPQSASLASPLLVPNRKLHRPHPSTVNG